MYYNILQYGEANVGPDHTKAAAVRDAEAYLDAFFSNHPHSNANDITQTYLGTVLVQKQQVFTHQWLEDRLEMAKHHWIASEQGPSGNNVFKAEHEKQAMEVHCHCLRALKWKWPMDFPDSTDYIILRKDIPDIPDLSKPMKSSSISSPYKQHI
jgi:hypothetical protein